MRVRVECDGIHQGHIRLPVHHDTFVSCYVYDLSDNTASVLVVLIFDELTLQAEGEFVNDRGINSLCFAGGKTAAGKFIGHFIS